MEISYWQSRWQKNNTGWHMDVVYPPLPKLWSRLSIKTGEHVLVPLCGKSLDLHWLVEQGMQVTGVEASPKALREVRQQYREPFSQDSSHGFTVYRSEHMELWQGDFLKVPVSEIPTPDLVYDKAAIVALPPDMRNSYVRKLLELCGPETQLLIQAFEYNQQEMSGPAFSVEESELERHLGDRFALHLMHEQSKLEELSKFQQRGLSSYLTEKVYHLTPLHGDS